MSALKSMSQSLKNPAKLMKMKHKKLDEDWFDTREPIQDGMRFSAKYLGMTLVDEKKVEDATASAVQRIINMAKGTKKRGVQCVVSSKGIKIYDQMSSQIIADIAIHRISYCAAMKQHLKVFAFVAQNAENETMECHAYLCNSVKEAQSLTVTVAQSFKIAYEIGEEQQATTEKTENKSEKSDFIVLNGEKKTTPLAITTVTEKRYQRFSSESNPFDSSGPDINSPTVSTPEDKKIMKLEEQQSKTDNIGPEVFIFTTPLTNFPQQPSTPKSSQPITPLKPPPASTDKSTPRRTPRPTSVGTPLSNATSLYQAVQTPSPSQSTPDVEDWDQGFADLALSRTKENPAVFDPSPETPTKVMYPPSNPFFSPGNPFST